MNESVIIPNTIMEQKMGFKKKIGILLVEDDETDAEDEEEDDEEPHNGS